jgi:probable F420-dependent oxidoreductase
MKKLNFGVVLPVEGNVSGGRPDPSMVLEMAESAERLGYASVWVGDRLLFTPRLEPLATLGAVAARTKGIRLGTAVLLAALRNPVLLAHTMATLDILSAGRMIFGIGIGVQRSVREYIAAQVPFGRRGTRVEECIQIIKKLWTEGSVTFSGKHYRLENINLPLRPEQRNGPPLWIGGSTERALRRTAQLGDGWLPMEIDAEQYKQGISKISGYAAKREREPSSIHKAFYMTLNIMQDRGPAYAEAQEFLNTYYNVRLPSIEKFGVFGTTADCIRRIEQYSASGLETIVIRFASFEPLAQMRNFAQSVLPAFT